MSGHPIIVLGASAGGLAPLKEILRGLPPDFPASLFVVVHMPRKPAVDYADGLQRASPLPLAWAQNGESIRPGRVYVAPPNRHLLLKRECVRVLFGARENRVRPAADVLFRSAAVAHGAGVVGVVLSGYQDDGAAGLWMIKQCGGATVVLDPATAEAPSMPREAIVRAQGVDFVLPAADIADVLARLATAEAEAEPKPNCPQAVMVEAAVAEKTMSEHEEPTSVGSTTALVCPDCGGVLREIAAEGPQRFRCRVGHTFSSNHLLQAMDDEVERAMWVAARTLRERADLLRKLASSHSSQVGKGFEERAGEVERQGRLLEDVLAELFAARNRETDVAEEV